MKNREKLKNSERNSEKFRTNVKDEKIWEENEKNMVVLVN